MAEIGRGERDRRDVPRILAARRRSAAGRMAPAAGLYRDLLAEALDELPETVRQLVIVPDGPLHRLPFAALRPAADAPPLVDRTTRAREILAGEQRIKQLTRRIDRRHLVDEVLGPTTDRPAGPGKQIWYPEGQAAIGSRRPRLQVGHLHAGGRIDAVGRFHQ